MVILRIRARGGDAKRTVQSKNYLYIKARVSIGVLAENTDVNSGLGMVS